MPRKNVEEYVESVQAEITNCPTCQPYDTGECVWVFGRQTSLDDLLGWHGVPERLWDDVANRLECPSCGAPISRPTDVGTKFDFEIEYEGFLERAEKRWNDKLFEFTIFLQRFPYLGATHRVGKAILKSIGQFPKVILGGST